MKIDLKINEKPFNKTNTYNVLYILLCVVRLFAFMPCILLILCSIPLMYLLGVKDPVDIWIRFNEGVVFNYRND
jgi:hypothetical protein